MTINKEARYGREAKILRKDSVYPSVINILLLLKAKISLYT